MQVSVRGTWLVRRALPPLLTDGRGRVGNIASNPALWGQTKLLAYVASKGAVIALAGAGPPTGQVIPADAGFHDV